MSEGRLQMFALATAGCAVLFGSPVTAQGSDDTARFAAPKRIKAGDEFLGAGRLYPSPVLHDVDGDKRPDVVVGDLFGRVTFACLEASRPAVVLGSEKPLKDRSGEQLNFHNW